MKNKKRIFTLFIMSVLVIALATPAFATEAEEADPDDADDVSISNVVVEGDDDAVTPDVSFTDKQILYNIVITKKDDGTDNTLAGVEFMLADAEGEAIKKAETDENGEVEFSGLTLGDYVITETATLPGYSLLANPIEVKITGTAISVNGKECTAEDNEEEPESTVENSNDQIYVTPDENGDTLHITVYNNKNLSVPSSGAMGVIWIVVIVVAAAVVVTVVTRRRSSKRK